MSNLLKTIANRRPYKNQVIAQLQNYQTAYNKSGFFNDFLFRLESFALGLEDRGCLDIAGMIFSKLAKFPADDRAKEQFLRGGLRVARKQSDPIHTLARIVDLKKLYEVKGKKFSHRHFEMLFLEEQELCNIVNNFPQVKRQYKTVAKGTASRETYLYRLGITMTEIAKRLHPHEARPRLLDAREIFAELDRPKELMFVEKMLSKY